LNAANALEVGGALIVADADFTPDYVAEKVIPILSHASTMKSMASASKSIGILDATQLLRDLLMQTVDTRARD